MGPGPSFLDPLGTICDIAGMVFDFLVWVATGGVLLLLAHLVKEGLKAISNLVSTAISAVEAAVNRIVDAFLAFVDWAGSFITNLIHSVIDPVANAIYDLWSNYKASVNSALLLAEADYSSTGEVSDNALRTLRSALDGELYYVILGVTLSISIILFAITCVTNVLSFLLITAMSILAYVIIENAFATNDAQEVDINPREYVGNGDISNLTNEIFITYGSSYGAQIDA